MKQFDRLKKKKLKIIINIFFDEKDKLNQTDSWTCFGAIGWI